MTGEEKHCTESEGSGMTEIDATLQVIAFAFDNGLCGFWTTICGKWIHPQFVTDEMPKEARMCKQCAKKEADHEVS